MLNNTKIKNLKAKDSEYGVADSHGLSVRITPKGVKKWRFRYRYDNKASMISLGKYPAVSLAQARMLRDENQALLSQGINPSTYKKQLKIKQQQKITFREAFDRWFNRHEGEWAKRTAQKQVATFEKHIFPYIGNTPIEDIKTPDILHVLRQMDDKGISIALKKVKGWSSRVFKDCVVTGLIEYDPIANISNEHFKKHKTKHHATVTNEDDIKELLLTLENYKGRGTYQIAEALNLTPYLLLRPGEVSKLTWKEVNFKEKLIRIKAENMKMGREHLVFLSKQVLSKLKEIKSLSLSDTYVFPSPKKSSSPIGAESLRAAIRRLGIPKEKFTTHGFRSMASTRLNEMGFNSDWIEMQLAHVEANKIRGAYNNAEYVEKRRDMMQRWSDYLDDLKGSSNG